MLNPVSGRPVASVTLLDSTHSKWLLVLILVTNHQMLINNVIPAVNGSIGGAFPSRRCDEHNYHLSASHDL